MSAFTPDQTPTPTPTPAPAAPADAPLAARPAAPAGPQPAAQAERYQTLAGCLTLLLLVAGVFVAMGLFIALFGDVQ